MLAILDVFSETMTFIQNLLFDSIFCFSPTQKTMVQKIQVRITARSDELFQTLIPVLLLQGTSNRRV